MVNGINFYPNREVVQRCINNLFSSTKAINLKQMCWIQRHKVVILYDEMQVTVVSALEILSNILFKCWIY